MTKEGSATYIDSPIDYNSYDGLPYYRQFANGTHMTEQLNKAAPISGTTWKDVSSGTARNLPTNPSLPPPIFPN